MTFRVKQASMVANAKDAIKITTIANVVLALLMFLLAMNFRQQWYYLAYFAAAAYLILDRGHFKLSAGVFLLTGFSLALVVFWPEGHATYTNILKQLAFPLLFLIGYNVMSRSSSGQLSKMIPSESAAVAFLAVIGLGCFTHLVLNYSINMGATSRYVFDYWTRELLSATGQASLACIPVGLFCGLLFTNRGGLAKISAVAGLAVILGYNLILAGRTIIVMIVAILVVAYAAKMQYSGAGRKMLYTLLVAGIGLACVAIFVNDWFGARTLILGSNLSSRFETMGVSEDGRMAYKLEHLELLPMYLWGGSNVLNITGGYAHDLLLDIFDAGGVLSFLFMLAFVIYVFAKIIKLMKSKWAEQNTKILALCVFSAFAIEFFVEPILYGMPWLLALFCFASGLIVRIADSQPQEEMACDDRG